jgi:protease II
MFTFYRVFCKKMQSDEADFLVFTENDVNCCVDITSTKDFKYITVNSNTRTSSEEGFYFNFFWAQYQIFAMFRPVMYFWVCSF